VFGDNRVRGTLEQMMLQVDLVRLRDRAWASLRDFYRVIFFIMDFLDCNLWFMNIDVFYN